MDHVEFGGGLMLVFLFFFCIAFDGGDWGTFPKVVNAIRRRGFGRTCLSIIHGLSLGSPRVIRKLDTMREFENVWIYLWRGPV